MAAGNTIVPNSHPTGDRPRVMISSIMEGYDAYREAARRGVARAGGEPVLVEDFPSLPTSPRNACLDAVESADIYLGILALRGGWRAPSGKLVVQEEFEHAVRRGKPALVVMQEGERDDDARELAQHLSDYVQGGFRRTFSTPEELHQEVEAAVAPQIELHARSPMSPNSLNHALEAIQPFPNDATLAVGVAPTREEEVIDPVRIGEEEFFDVLMEIGHRREVQLFTHRLGKTPELRGGRLVIVQRGDGGRPPRHEVRLELNDRGLLVVAGNVTGRRSGGGSFGIGSSLEIIESDLEEVLLQVFNFTRLFYDEIDPPRRYQSFLCNGVVVGIGYRRIASAPSRGQGVPVAIHAPDRITAYDPPRTIPRQSLAQPDDEIRRMVTLLKRRLEE